MGWWENGRPDTESGRFEQVYDARIDADGLSFSFIPNGDSQELFEGFFPAATTIPSFETSFDPDGRVSPSASTTPARRAAPPAPR